jgi:hypothetical protein
MPSGNPGASYCQISEDNKQINEITTTFSIRNSAPTTEEGERRDRVKENGDRKRDRRQKQEDL